ncbi:hypothetical protein [Lonepinella sp. BR2474]|uniref:hypothetical protein n=1 Tax=Lonepinella sp. BR2474 TaxID=3434548 RepID=UPI003F6E1CF5
MLKKISAVLFLTIFAFFTLLYVQKGKIEQKFTALLAENAVQSRQVEFHFFPPVAVELKDVRYVFGENQQLLARSLRAELSLWHLLQGEMNLQAFQLEQGQLFYHQLASPDLTALDVQLHPEAPLSLQDLSIWLKSVQENQLRLPNVKIHLSAKTAQQDHITLNSKFSVASNQIHFSDLDSQLNLQNKRLFNQDKLVFHAEQGELIFQPQQDELILIQPTFNQIKWDKIQTDIDRQVDLTIRFNAERQADQASLLLVLDKQQDQYVWSANGKNLGLENWLTAFNIPELTIGRANVDMRLISDEWLPKQGDFYIEVVDGKVKGVNILTLISQYVPVNFDENSQNMDTSFDFALAKFHWQPSFLQVEKAKIQHRYFVLNTQGRVEFSQNRCDFNAAIHSPDPRYQSLALPVHFFGNCQSPEYKVDIQRNFRDQLKNFIKEKLK